MLGIGQDQRSEKIVKGELVFYPSNAGKIELPHMTPSDHSRPLTAAVAAVAAVAPLPFTPPVTRYTLYSRPSPFSLFFLVGRRGGGLDSRNSRNSRIRGRSP